MSIQAALNFISKSRLALVGWDPETVFELPATLADLQKTAKLQGLDFSLGELREAHAIDWGLRLQRLKTQRTEKFGSKPKPSGDDILTAAR